MPQSLPMTVAGMNLIQEEQRRHLSEFFKEHFIPDEPVSRSVGLAWNNDAERAMMTQIKQNISLANVSDTHSEITSGITYMVVDNKSLTEATAEKPIIWSNVVQLLRNRCNVFQHYNINEALYIGEICTHREFRRKGFATKILKAAIILLKHFDFNGAVVFADITSKFSQQVFEKVGFDTLTEVMYSKFTENGDIVCKDMGQHDSIRLVAKII